MTLNEAKAHLKNFQEKRSDPGGFLHAILTNDLFGAIRRADATSAKDFLPICRYVWAELPGNIWGTTDKVAAHLQGPQPQPDPQADVQEVSLATA
jgi:DNA-directed RNA polymerase specialized sigma24 family protein